MCDSGIDPARLENVKHLDGGAIRAACPACRAVGSDKTGEHLLIQPDGKFGCATHPDDREHRKDIFRLVGIPMATGPAKRNGSPSRIVKTYPYPDEGGNIRFEVVRYDPKDFRQRRPDPARPGEWFWNMDGVARVLYRLPDVLKAKAGGKPVFIAEGEKDCDCLAKHGFTATCNPGGAGKWQDSFSETLRGADVVIIADKDKAGRDHAQLVAGKLHGVSKTVSVLELPDTNGKAVKDAFDFFAAGGDAGQVFDLVDKTPEWTPDNSDRLTLRTPDEILAMQFDDSDRILGDRLLASGQSLVVSGQGGIGKSRLLLQMAVACRAGLPFVSFETRGQELSWLILQAENSNRRLKDDLESLRRWIGAEHWPQVNAGLKIHTLESDLDGFLSVSSPKAQLAIKAAVESCKPDIVVFDSLYNFGAGNLNSDEDMAETLLTLSRLAKAGNPRRAIVILHHAGTGKAGAAKAIGFDRSSFGRNSKVLHSWTRGQINIAPGSPDDDAVFVLTCGKCSNGKEFPMFAIRLNPETMIYAPDETFDLSAWQADVTGKRTEQDLSPARVAETVAELCKTSGAPKRPAIVKALRDETGCAMSGAYKAIDRAERAKAIHYTKATKTYVTQ
jgi:5S rRNA maturation endonuclease (ribonuclease M5)